MKVKEADFPVIEIKAGNAQSLFICSDQYLYYGHSYYDDTDAPLYGNRSQLDQTLRLSQRDYDEMFELSYMILDPRRGERGTTVGDIECVEADSEMKKRHPLAVSYQLYVSLEKETYSNKALLIQLLKKFVETFFSFHKEIDYLFYKLNGFAFPEDVLGEAGFMNVGDDVFEMKSPEIEKSDFDKKPRVVSSFDKESQPVFDPLNFYERSRLTFKTVVISYSYRLRDELLRQGEIEVADNALGASSMDVIMYRIKGTDIGFVLSGVGAPFAASVITECFFIYGTENIIAFGSAGVLTPLTSEIVVLSAAFRDEGVSYHYKESSDFIKIRSYEKIKEIFDAKGVKYDIGRTWTTDAFYAETVNKIKDRRERGCKVVEMEIASLEAVCSYYDKGFYPFVYSSDKLNDDEYDKGELTHEQAEGYKLFRFYEVAKLLAEEVDSGN